MVRKIKQAAVLGSGVMGAGIAAHLANIGIPTLMLDIVPDELTEEEKQQGFSLHTKAVRNRIANNGKKALLKQKPSPLTSSQSLELITVGNMVDDMERLAEVDWVIEAVVENLEIKKKVLQQVDRHRTQGTIVSSNTSGISIEKMSADCSEDFKRHFLGTHFFNPPRYLKLLEIIPTKWTANQVLNRMKKFGEDQLGKGVVEAKDTPNFIANRIGTFGLLITIKEMQHRGLSVGEVDSVTGPLIGRPKSATFRTLDVVGLDTFSHVAKNVFEQVEGQEKAVFALPSFLQEMLAKRWLGAKSGQGFYVKRKGQKGSVIQELNIETLSYQDKRKWKTPAIERANKEKGLNEKMKALVYSEGDRAGEFIWAIMKQMMLYAARLSGEIADDILAIDNAMKWGFGWRLGPFETWDAIGWKKAAERMKAEGERLPDWIEEMLATGFTAFYKQENGTVFYYHHGEYKPAKSNEKHINLSLLKETKGVIKRNAGASLIDLGDGVAGLEFQSKSNAIGPDIVQMVNEALEEVEKNYEGLVIGNQGKNFCVGANLAMMLMEAQEDNYFEIEFIVREFQNAMMKIKYADKPVVAAPFGMTLGGGAEVCLPASSVQAALETYIGLVEVGVGLIPGGGGSKELYMKQVRDLPGVTIDLQQIAIHVFETIALAKVSASAAEGRARGFLTNRDGFSVNQDQLIYDAKQKVLALSRAGYVKPAREKVPVTGEAGFATMLLGAKSLRMGGYASDHDVKIAEKLAFVLAGGRVKAGTLVDEQYLLDLEREAFLSLIGERKTQERMQHMLLKGKPLRN